MNTKICNKYCLGGEIKKKISVKKVTEKRKREGKRLIRNDKELIKGNCWLPRKYCKRNGSK